AGASLAWPQTQRCTASSPPLHAPSRTASASDHCASQLPRAQARTAGVRPSNASISCLTPSPNVSDGAWESPAQQGRLCLLERLRSADQASEARRQADASELRADASALRAESLEAELADLKLRKTERGLVLTLGDVLFDTGQATLKSGANGTLDRLAAALRDKSG